MVEQSTMHDGYAEHAQDTGGKIVHVFRFQKLNLIQIRQETVWFFFWSLVPFTETSKFTGFPPLNI